MCFKMRRHILSLMIIWIGSCATGYSTILQGAIEVPSIKAVSGINFAESGPNPGRRRDSDEGYFLRVVADMQNQSLSSGEKAQFRCRVEGYPTNDLTFTWYRSNEVIDVSQEPRYSIRQKDVTSRFQIRDVFTADSGRYRCEASNGHRRVATEAYLKVSFVLPPSPGPDEEPVIPKGKCEKYSGYACRPHLANKYVYIDPYQQQSEVENLIAMAVNRIKDPGMVSDTCQQYAIPALCYYVFPVCEDEDDVLSALHGRKSPEERATRLCREDCELLMHDVCKDEFANPDDDMFMEEISSTANCSQLPPTTSRGSSCLKVGLPPVVKHKHTCYNNTGTDYKGTQRKTTSGIRCKSWPSDLVKEHTELAGGHNFCRNPGNAEDRPWCYIDDARRTRELCDVSKCAVPSTGSGLYAILIPSVAVPLFILCTVAICLFCLARRRKERSKGIQGKPVTNGNTFHSVEMTMAPKQISHNIPHVNPQSLHFTMDLGDGQFGKVYKAQLSQNMNFNSNFPVAVKTLTEGAMSCQVDEFQREMEKLSEIQHPNVACLKAVVIHPSRRCMIFEYTNRVDLHEFLSLHSPHSDVVVSTKTSSSASSQTSNSLEPHDFINMMTQISSGLDYLTSHNYFHRDLAARNILVCQNNLLKICNLDVVRDCHLSSYYRSPQGGRMLPIRWMAPECIAHSTYSGKTTIWSFGVLIWEIYSYGMQPYCGYSNQEVLDMITRFQLLTCPDQCPARVYSLMRECWTEDPAMRPNFKEIYAKLCGWDNSNATRMTSQLARGIHRQVTNIMREGQYGQYSGMDSASLPSYNTPSPPPTYNAVAGVGGYPNIPQQQQFNPPVAPHMDPTSHNVFGQSSGPNTSAQMYPGQRLVVDLQDPRQVTQNYQGNYETTTFQPRYYADHQNSQVYMGGNNIRRPGTQSSRSTSSCASSCSEYAAVSRPSSAGHSYGHPQHGPQYQKFYGGVDYHDQHFQQQNAPNIQTYRRPLSGVIEDECGSSITQKSHVNPSTTSVDLPPFPNSGYSDTEAAAVSRDAKTSVTEQCMTRGQQVKETPDMPKIQNEETESSTSSSSAKAPSCDSGLPVDEDADTTNLANQSTSITSPLLGPKPYIPKTPTSRALPFKSMSDRNFVG